MCGFMVYTKKEKKEEFLEGFEKIQYRGPDMTRILYEDQYILGFHRLAIMGLDEKGMQPFCQDNSKCVCNGEIYNYQFWKKQLEKEGITFKSDSDCEIILPLYKKFKTDMFKKLDAEFAMVLYDEEKKDFIAARDPIGIRPMFYGYSDTGNIAFASEAKALMPICQKVYPFPVGHYYADGKFTCYNDIKKSSKYHTDSLKQIQNNVHDKLTKAVIKRLNSDAKIGFLLSGGLDSSLVCSIASKHLNKPIDTFAIGMHKDAIDLKYAKDVANFIKSNHTEVIMTEKDVLKALKEIIYHLETWDITTIRASVGMYLLCKWIKEHTDIKVLLTGEVSDELFGYKYTDFAPNANEFQKECEKRMSELYYYDVLRADRCISGCSLEARVPFGDLDFVDYVMGIEPTKKINQYGIGKYLLRSSFTTKDLPEHILYREKAAFSDAVGHSMVDFLKKYAEELYTDDEFYEKKQIFKTHTPFTKESLMYREIFEQFYPGQDDLIIDYWMPNKTWPGCDVNDPSARVLKNYGKSGK